MPRLVPVIRATRVGELDMRAPAYRARDGRTTAGWRGGAQTGRNAGHPHTNASCRQTGDPRRADPATAALGGRAGAAARARAVRRDRAAGRGRGAVAGLPRPAQGGLAEGRGAVAPVRLRRLSEAACAQPASGTP